MIITLPALWKSPRGIPTAFYAVVSISVIGLYLAFLIPIWYDGKQAIVYSRGVESWKTLQVDEPGSCCRDRHHVFLFYHAIRACRHTMGSKLYLACGKLCAGAFRNYLVIIMGLVGIIGEKWFTGPRKTIE